MKSETQFREPARPHPLRILIGKVGLDGHDRGAKYVAHILRDAGFEVIYTGIRRTPEQIAESAVQEDVAAVGLSFLSGAHVQLFRRVIDLLKARNAGEVLLVGGGTIPERDVETLKAMGVAEVFTPGTPAKAIVERLKALLQGASRG
jgi:methylmalonyl-CoA mutase, C-terminal domain